MLCLGVQTCKLVVWTPKEYLVLDIPFDREYTKCQVEHLLLLLFTYVAQSCR